jgi:acyl dehydratase
MSINFKDAAALQTLVTEELGPWSNEILIDQDLINQYADLSGDKMWLHVDVERCKTQSPFKTTIAHGFLLLSLLPKMQSLPDVSSIVTGYSHMMNYGSDRLRFLSPVMVNSKIHARSRIKVIEVSDKKTKVTCETHVHAVGSDAPALIYELAFVFM